MSMEKNGTRVTMFVKPDYLRKLIDSGLSPGEIAPLIGKTQSVVSQALQADSIVKTTELACQLIYEQKTGHKNTKSVAVISSSKSHLETIRELIKNLGGEFTYV